MEICILKKKKKKEDISFKIQKDIILLKQVRREYACIILLFPSLIKKELVLSLYVYLLSNVLFKILFTKRYITGIFIYCFDAAFYRSMKIIILRMINYLKGYKDHSVIDELTMEKNKYN